MAIGDGAAVFTTATPGASVNRLSGGVIDYNADYTIALSFKITTTSGENSLYCLRKDQYGGESDIIVINSSSGIDLIVWADDGIVITSSSGSLITNDQWHRIVAVRDGDTVTAYLDGVEVVSATQATASRSANVAMFFGANEDGQSKLSGNEFGAAAWTRVFSPAEAIRQSLQISPFDGTSLFGFWPTMSEDHSGNGRDLTESGTITRDHATPAVAWAPQRVIVQEDAAPSGVTGTGAAIGLLGVGAATGTQTITGTGAAVGLVGVGSATGTQTITGTAAAVGLLGVGGGAGSQSTNGVGAAVGLLGVGAAVGTQTITGTGAAVGLLGIGAGAGSQPVVTGTGAAVGLLGVGAGTGTQSTPMVGTAVGLLGVGAAVGYQPVQAVGAAVGLLGVGAGVAVVEAPSLAKAPPWLPITPRRREPSHRSNPFWQR